MKLFNTIWSGPETLPLPAEIENHSDGPTVLAQLRAARSSGPSRRLRPLGVGLSGGPDSLALTAVAARLWPYHAIVDHGLRPARPRSRKQLAYSDFAGMWTQVLASRRTAGSREAAARLRYSALEERRDGPVLLAHTLDNQAETGVVGAWPCSEDPVDRRHASVRSALAAAAGVRRATHAACRGFGPDRLAGSLLTDRR